MKTRLIEIWIRTQSSYWFLPGLLSAGALVMAVVLVRADYALGDTWLESFAWLRINQAEGARALLSTVAGSMITVAGVTFSMTLLAVSHATSQIGPHLLSAFMRDRGNQLTLGTFIATFLYCLMLLRSIHSAADSDTGTGQDFIPHIAVTGALLLTVLSVVVLIYFIHHVPQSINVTHVVARVGNELVAGIHALYPDKIGAANGAARDESGFETQSAPPCVLATPDPGGYLRIIDDDELMHAATQADLIIEICKHPGEFSLPGEELMRIWPAREIDRELKNSLQGCFTWGSERTPNQDVLLPMQQLLEILGRALSPGINNQYTALLCIDQLGRGLGEMLQQRIPASGRRDNDGTLRIIARPIDHQRFLDELIFPLHQYTHDDGIACRRVRDILLRLEWLCPNATCGPGLRAAIERFDA